MPRPLCPGCQLPLARCYCDLAIPVASAVEVIVWQHPSEANHPKGTAALLNRCLGNCQMLVAEQLSEAQFERFSGPGERQTWLLFPGSDAAPTGAVPMASSVRLLVLDGTWRKARKLMHLNPWLQQLPRLALAPIGASEYTIRKSEQPHQLSTLEATCQAINLLERDSTLTAPLLNAFQHYMRRLSQRRPSTTSSP
ncbi:MAG: DTW domain-containing protein [Gammaproteobacteria bacterium]|uniref:DTW domain-containing protein n=1 Tax=Pseudomaricurvus alcaniphilus TaxID=1166482 RepID=UPI001409D676|nr:DTW domain-containing protein [Gammaproteobacteria bacterium]NHN35693.1 DTW domain-containing protein [Pseudomaricurvus alcaniphilus]